MNVAGLLLKTLRKLTRNNLSSCAQAYDGPKSWAYDMYDSKACAPVYDGQCMGYRSPLAVLAGAKHFM